MRRIPDTLDLSAADTVDDFPAAELFLAATTAVLICVEASGCVVAANPAALRLLRMPRTEVVGRDWRGLFDAAAIDVCTSAFRSSAVSYLVLQLAAPGDAWRPAAGAPDALFERLDALPTGFVVTDDALCIEYWNRAFAELVATPAPGTLAGQSLLRWLNLSQADLALLHRQMTLRLATATFTTTLCTGDAFAPAVEVVAVAVPDQARCWGFTIRRVLPGAVWPAR